MDRTSYDNSGQRNPMQTVPMGLYVAPPPPPMDVRPITNLAADVLEQSESVARMAYEVYARIFGHEPQPEAKEGRDHPHCLESAVERTSNQLSVTAHRLQTILERLG